MLIHGRDLWELITRRVAATPDGEMLVDDHGERVTFAEFTAQAETLAAGLADRYGIGPGDVVTWTLPTWNTSVVLTAALSRLGVVQNPIIPIYREREVGFCTRQADSRLLIVPGVWNRFDYKDMADRIAGDSRHMQVLVLTRDPATRPAGDPAGLPPLPTPPDDPDELPVRWLLYTSGTTADPKGARHSDHTLITISDGMAERLGMDPSDRVALVFPFTHVGGIMWLFSAMQYGVAMLMCEAFNATDAVDFLSREDCTMAGSGQSFFNVFLARQREQPDRPLFPNLKVNPAGGSPKAPEVHYECQRELGGRGVCSGWGLTESPILAMAGLEDPDEKLSLTEGRAMPGVQLRVVRTDGTEAAPGEEGELRAKAPQMMRGYLDTSLNDEAFDEQGWFRTGDLGIIDTEGYVVITGRLKDIIIRNGENISAKELEDLLYTHPKVADVAVVGLPDARTQERACAVVATAEGADPLEFVEMQEYLRSFGLMQQKLPEQLEFVNAVPRNPTGKPLKQQLRDEMAERPFQRSP